MKTKSSKTQKCLRFTKKWQKGKTFFVCSDTHSCYQPLIDALKENNWDINNPNHILVLVGDAFDRGDDTVFVFNFLKDLHSKNRLVYIRGNHEDLLLDLVSKHTPEKHDWSNGTVKTCCSIAGVETKLVDPNYWTMEYLMESGRDVDPRVRSEYVMGKTIKAWKDVIKKVKKSGILEFIIDNTIPYIEIDNYIITHSFIPTKAKESFKDFDFFLEALSDSCKEVVPNWRKKATPYEWYSARWGAPHTQIEAGLFDEEIANDKILVFGHWWAFDVRNHVNKVQVKTFDEVKDFTTFKTKNYIAIDGCTPTSGIVNVLKIEK